MGSTEFGNFEKFCRDSTLPVCNLLSDEHSQAGPWDTADSCKLEGIPLSGGRHLGNVGSIILCAIAIAVTAYLIYRSSRRKAAVGRLEMQIFLVGYLLMSICEVFSVGDIPLGWKVRVAFSAVHIGLITATTWILMLNAVVGFQIIDDGTPLSLILMVSSAGILLIGTGYIALDTGMQWTGYWDSSYEPPNRNIALYVLYQLAPLVFIVAFYVLEAILVLRILGERAPMLYITAAAILFAGGQVINYVASPHICSGTDGKIDGALFQTLLTLASVVLVWMFWSSITEDDWQVPVGTSYP